MQIQEYDLEIVHIKGTDNFLADIMNLNPVGLTGKESESMRRPREIMVKKSSLDLDPDVRKALKNLSVQETQDRRIEAIKPKLARTTQPLDSRYKVEGEILFCKDEKFRNYWRPYLTDHLEPQIIKYVHHALGHAGTDKTLAQIAHSFYMRNLGRKVRKFVASCPICQKVKHPSRSYDTEIRSYSPKGPGELLAVDLYGNLPSARAGLKHILVCIDVFSKHVKLYALRAATTRTCLNKLTGHYFTQLRRPKSILSDHGTQFNNNKWKATLSDLGTEVKYSPIHHLESNPAGRIMRSLGTFFKIYCDKTHRKRPELLAFVESWLNSTVSSTTGFAPMELMFGDPTPDIFREILKKTQDQIPEEASLEDKVLFSLRTDQTKSRKKKAETKGWQCKMGT
jgi:hypothetical protein